MAKLSGVKVIDMTAGEVTKVAYEGAEYILTQEAPAVDDIIRTDGAWSGTVEEGNFYKCVDLDEDGDARIVTDLGTVARHFRKHYEVFRKVAAQGPTIEARVGKLESDVAALKGEQATATPKFKAGDKVRGKLTGFVYTLESRRPDRDERDAGLAWETELGGWIGENQVELVEAKAALKVGDCAKVVGRTYLGDIAAGTVVKITKEADEDGDYKIVLLDESNYDYAQASSLEKVDADKAAIIDKWAKIGREVDEYKEGDVVRVLDVKKSFAFDLSRGEINVITKFCDNDSFQVGSGSGWVGASQVELVAPVESRVDR